MPSSHAAAAEHSAIPLISVIVPLADSRGQAVRALESWTRQTLTGGAFEIIAVADGAAPQVVAAAEKCLRPRDRLLTTAEPLLALYNHGARHAVGKWLLLTESHVVAEPECLAEMLQHLQEHAPEGACCGSGELPGNRYAEMEGRLFQLSWPGRVATWDRVTLRGVAIRRDIFLSTGGFPVQFGHYAELALGAHLHDVGFNLGYAERARVNHYNTQSPEEMEESLLDYAAGEIAYREAGEPHLLEEYLGPCPLWERREFLRPENARWLGRLVLGRLLRGDRQQRELPAYRSFLLRYAPTMLFGPNWNAFRTRGLRLLHRLGAALGSPRGDFAFKNYRRYWEGTLRLGRQRAVSRYLKNHAAVEPQLRCELVRREAGVTPLDMNWCRDGGIGLLQFQLEAGTHRLEFEWRTSRGLFETVFVELVHENEPPAVCRLRGIEGSWGGEITVPETANGPSLRRIAWLMPEMPHDVELTLSNLRVRKVAQTVAPAETNHEPLTRRERLQRAA